MALMHLQVGADWALASFHISLSINFMTSEQAIQESKPEPVMLFII